MLKPKTALDQDMDTIDMSLIEKYIKLTISSLTPVNYTIDLSRYFLEPPAGSSNFYQRSDQSSDDPFSFASRTFTLTIDEDLSALDKDSFRDEVAYYEPEDGHDRSGPFQNVTRYNIDISIFDPVSGPIRWPQYRHANGQQYFPSIRHPAEREWFIGFGRYEHDFQGWRQIHWIKPE